MEQQQQNEQDLSFRLNGKDYKYNDCTDEQKQIVQQLNDLQGQMTELDFKFNQLQALNCTSQICSLKNLKKILLKKKKNPKKQKAES